YDAVNVTKRSWYIKITSDTYGTAEQVDSPISTFRGVDIAIDTNNLPHIVSAYSSGGHNYIWYYNRNGGVWSGSNAVKVEDSTTNIFFAATITFSNSKLPELNYIDQTGTTLKAAIGNVNIATSFTTQSVDASVNATAGQMGASITLDPSGNTWITY